MEAIVKDDQETGTKLKKEIQLKKFYHGKYKMYNEIEQARIEYSSFLFI
jgi:hypothetical protein